MSKQERVLVTGAAASIQTIPSRTEEQVGQG